MLWLRWLPLLDFVAAADAIAALQHLSASVAPVPSLPMVESLAKNVLKPSLQNLGV